MKLIFLDIDGTLTVPGENTPPASAMEAIRAAQKNGHKVFLCSGRNWAMLLPLLEFGFDGVVASAGGYVRIGDEVLCEQAMPQNEFEQALDLLHRNGVFCTIEAVTGTWGDENLNDFLKDQPAGNSEIERWRKALSDSLDIRPMGEYDGSPILKFALMCTDRSQLAEAEEQMGDAYRFVMQEVAGKGCLNGEMLSRAFDKGTGIRRVCEYYGMSVDDAVGFGDSMNDLEMLQTVGTAVCMENGAEACKAAADYVCPPVDRDGLAEGFRHLGLV